MISTWRRLAGDADPGLVARAVRLAATPWVRPERIRAAVQAGLDSGAAGAEPVAWLLHSLESTPPTGAGLADAAAAQAAAGALLDAGAVVTVVGQPGYPAQLASAWPELGAPPWLFVRAPGGRLPAQPAVAVVGTRHPTLDGLHTARTLAGLLARHGVTVVSGMARGIDQAAHHGALERDGATVAVLGTGFGVDYPARDGALRQSIAQSGGLVSELLPGVGPRPEFFLWRNRIISALADITVVVEGRARSGALHTARMAAAQGREVLAVPGSLHAPTSRAPLDLIRDGAIPLTRLEDVLDLLDVSSDPPSAARAPVAARQRGATRPLSPVADRVLALLGAVPCSPGTLAAAAGEPVAAVVAAVAELTAAGLSVTTPRGPVLRPDPTVATRR